MCKIKNLIKIIDYFLTMKAKILKNENMDQKLQFNSFFIF